ncbi:SatD family protein [Maribacter sp. 2308TA10-17]|uniref:SatD family protein n=1 Tax=Maribacter sp. 2308TA10-17 TaxID=3386276 RepID=UPI0039BC51D1
MIAIITGDIINSEEHKASEWIDILKKQLSKWGETPVKWEIYRGDEFQLKVAPKKALWAALQIKAAIKSVKDLDVRMAIGVGSENFQSSSVSESNGTAYQRSGRTFETLKEEKLNLAIATGNRKEDQSLNLMIRLALDFMDEWTSVSAEIIAIALANPKLSQQEIAKQLHVQQSAISQRQKRANLDLVLKLLEYYPQTVKRMKP